MNTFNPETHEYFINGRRAQSVTQILKEVSLIDDSYYTEQGRVRGNAVHEATHFLDENDLDWEALHPAIRPYVEAYQKFKVDTGFVPDRIEHQVYNEIYFYGGTLDRTGVFAGGVKALLDIKTGSVEAWAALQTAGYQACLVESYQRFALELSKDGKYRLHPFKDPNDVKVFISAAVVANWKRNHGGLS